MFQILLDLLDILCSKLSYKLIKKYISKHVRKANVGPIQRKCKEDSIRLETKDLDYM